MTRDVARLIFMNGDVHEHLVMFMNITTGIEAFMNIPATFMNIKSAKKVGRQLLWGPVIFIRMSPGYS